MNTIENSPSLPAESVVFVITHTIRARGQAEYEAWLTEILGAVSSLPGYLGREVFRPVRGKWTYTIIVHFDTQSRLAAWVQSDARKSFVERVRHLLEKGDVNEIRTGLEFWFTPQGVKPPKRWKQFLLTLAAVYPLTLLIPSLLEPLLRTASLSNQYFNGFLVAASLTATLTFVVMPQLTKLASRWLFEEENGT